jgi:hypothetical protein
MVGRNKHDLVLGGVKCERSNVVKLNLGVLRFLFADLLLDYSVRASVLLIIISFIGPYPSVSTRDDEATFPRVDAVYLVLTG